MYFSFQAGEKAQLCLSERRSGYPKDYRTVMKDFKPHLTLGVQVIVPRVKRVTFTALILRYQLPRRTTAS